MISLNIKTKITKDTFFSS